MKLKAVAYLTIIVLFAGLFTGCSSNEDEEAVAVVEDEVERVVIMGEIAETVGNMITVKLMEEREPVELTEEERAEMQERIGQNINERLEEMTEEERAAMQEQFSQNFGGNVAERIGNMTEEERAAMQEQFSQGGFRTGGRVDADGSAPITAFGGAGMMRSYTGENKDIIIPAGAPIFESSYSEGEETQTEISLDKLKSGDIIEITYASDNETVAKVVKQAAMQGARQIITNGDGAVGEFRISGEGPGFFTIGDGVQLAPATP